MDFWHLPVTLEICNEEQYYNSPSGGDIDGERFDLEEEYREKFRCHPQSPAKELPLDALDAHGIHHGLCFCFRNKGSAEYARDHILEMEWFIEFLVRNPKFYFEVEWWETTQE